jgi:pilus assembly protein CpaB
METGNKTAGDKRQVRSQTLTLSVTLQESQLLALAMQRGLLTAVIRSPLDQTVTETPPDLQASTLTDSQKRNAIQAHRRDRPIKLDVER